MASKTDNRVLPNKEAALFRQLAKQYEVRHPAIAPSCMPPAGGATGSVIGLPAGPGGTATLPSGQTPTPPTGSSPSWASCCRCRLLAADPPALLSQTASLCCREPLPSLLCRPSSTRRASRMQTPSSRSSQTTGRRWP
jgi:hypothetical protein